MEGRKWLGLPNLSYLPEHQFKNGKVLIMLSYVFNLFYKSQNYKHDLKAIISYEFPYNDNKMIFLWILYKSAEYQLVQTVSSS